MRALVLLAALVVTSSCRLAPPSRAYVEADQRFAELIAPIVEDLTGPRELVLDDLERQLVRQALADWLDLVDAAAREQGLAPRTR